MSGALKRHRQFRGEAVDVAEHAVLSGVTTGGLSEGECALICYQTTDLVFLGEPQSHWRAGFVARVSPIRHLMCPLPRPGCLRSSFRKVWKGTRQNEWWRCLRVVIHRRLKPPGGYRQGRL